jgi:hypothetical protein
LGTPSICASSGVFGHGTARPSCKGGDLSDLLGFLDMAVSVDFLIANRTAEVTRVPVQLWLG